MVQFFYNQVITGIYTCDWDDLHFCYFAAVFQSFAPPKIVTKFADISFEIYLWHYMFTDGPLRLFGLTGYWLVDCLVVFAVSVLVAYIANRIVNLLKKRSLAR